MLLDLSHIGQIALPVTDADRAEAFYRTALGLRQLYRFGDLTFFDCAGVRLMPEKTDDPASAPRSSVIYFRCADIALAVRELRGRGITFDDTPASDRAHGRPRSLDDLLPRPGRARVGADAGSAEGL